MILGKFVLYLLICILVLAIIAFISDVINNYKRSKVAEFIFDICMRIGLVLAIEIVILILIQIFG